MSARIVPLSVLSFILMTIFCAVVATAQEGFVVPAQTAQAGALGQALGGAEAQPLASAPFTLSPEEQANLDRLLVDWQAMSAKVKTFEAEFTRWDYDGVFGEANVPSREAAGVIKYAAPDKGYYNHKQIEEKDERYNETWICTGDAVFQFLYDQKQVREHKLPEKMRGKAIADGPMPFVFGVEADKMKARYWLRITTPASAAQKNQVWLEAYPKHAKDAANFNKVEIILQFEFHEGVVTKLEPYAIKLVHPNITNSTTYLFRTQKVNTFLNNLGEFLGIFVRPQTPLNWQHQVVEESELADTAPPPTAAPAGPVTTLPPTSPGVR